MIMVSSLEKKIRSVEYIRRGGKYDGNQAGKPG